MKFKIQNSKFKIEGDQFEGLIKVLLENRGVKTKKEKDDFLNPKLSDVNAKNAGINIKSLKKAVERIKKAIENKEEIVVFGDYDVDGICATAILWETLHSLGADVMPYIPHRLEEGYGLSETGIKNLKLKIKNCSLIITVDNGIVANEAVDFANKQGIDVIITDHHVPSKKLPKAYAIVHTTKLCGTGVAYLLAKEFSIFNFQFSNKSHNSQFAIRNSQLELVALATVADLVPLKEANRTLLKFGLEELWQTKRVGLLELFKEAGIEKEKIGVYEIGHIIAPRLNAMGRLEHAMDSLRLLCTKNIERARILAKKLGETNRERQVLTMQTVEHAMSKFRIQNSEFRKLLFISHESYQQGVVGLVAGRLVEEFYRPAIVVSKGEKISRASARSVKGFNMIEFIRGASQFLIDAGGHPMAAGFTVETEKLEILQKNLEETAEKLLDETTLTRTLRIDCEIPLSVVNDDLYKSLQTLSPFGMGNPEPTFMSKEVVIEDLRTVGAENKHLKFRLSCHAELVSASQKGARSRNKFGMTNSKFGMTNNQVWDDKIGIGGIGFGMGDRVGDINIGDKVDIVYTIDRDTWNGNNKLQLKIKDISGN